MITLKQACKIVELEAPDYYISAIFNWKDRWIFGFRVIEDNSMPPDFGLQVMKESGRVCMFTPMICPHIRPKEKLFSANTFEDYEEKIKLIMD